MEALDWIIWQMTGEETRSACGAGYKAFYRHDSGYPTKDFFKALDPAMENIVEEKLDAPIKSIGETAGYLTDSMARELGLLAGTPVGTGIIDAHSSLPGCGIGKPGTMMIIVGTSSCHMMLSETEAGIAGVGGLVKDGIMPGYFGYEAGQCCVGDHFAWFTDNCVPESYEQEARSRGISIHQLLTEKLSGYKAGQSGLLALDWFNGVRSPLMDFNLNGLIMGMNLLTKPEEIYLSLIEATAYGTRMIIEQFENAGVPVNALVLSGGIPAKNKMLVQVYADVCNKEIRISGTDQASALGAAILGIAAAPDNILIGCLRRQHFCGDIKAILKVYRLLGRVDLHGFYGDDIISAHMNRAFCLYIGIVLNENRDLGVADPLAGDTTIINDRQLLFIYPPLQRHIHIGNGIQKCIQLRLAADLQGQLGLIQCELLGYGIDDRIADLDLIEHKAADISGVTAL